MEKKLLGKTICFEVQDETNPHRSLAQICACLHVTPTKMDIFKTKIEKALNGLQGFRKIDLEFPGGMCRVLVQVYFEYPNPINIIGDQTDSEAKRAVIKEIIPKIDKACLDVLDDIEFDN